MLRALSAVTVLLGLLPELTGAATYVAVPAGRLNSVLASPADTGPVPVAAFKLRTTPVTNAEFAAFVRAHPEWARGQVPSSLADGQYLHAWAAAAPEAPVVSVSWFAAQAFCESEAARLPTWNEWEYVAAADASEADARQRPEWRARILAWYARPSTAPLPAVGGAPNFYGVRDVHGLVWEWVDDFNALMVSADSRDQGDPDKLKFCGAGALSLQDRENYAVLMRIALLSSLAASDTTDNLGFRCARPATGGTP